MQTLLMISLLLLSADPLPLGKSTIEVRFGEVPLKLFVYKPANFHDGPMLMVFHGVLRNAEEYRDHSIPMGDRFGALIVAPLFDEKTFPKPKYQLGGIIVDEKGTAPDDRTGEYVNRIVKEIRRREGRADMPYSLIGHSGGGQFLVRLAAFIPTQANRIVAANPGTHTFPTLSAEFPYGFGGLPQELRTDEVLRAYLAQPLTIYLGSEDTERDEHLDILPAADAQGKFRFERGKNAFAAAKSLAAERKWPFGWELVVVNGIEHDHEKMFNHEECATALGWKPANLVVAEHALADRGPADITIENAKIFLPGTNHVAMAIKANRIVAVGSKADIEPLIGTATKRLNARGCSVTPGFNDAHVHFLSGSLGLSQVELSDEDSITTIEAKIRIFADKNQNLPWIIGRGWVYGTFPDGLPTKEQLDRMVADRPAIMKAYDGHTVWVNSLALQRANITQDTPDPKGGIIVKDPITGQPTGVLKESAQDLLENVLPKPTSNEKLDAIRAGIAAAHRLGVTSVLDAGVELPELELFETLSKDGPLSLRVNFALSGRPDMTESDADQLDSLRKKFAKLNIRSVKLFVDGVIESHTAVLLSQYANRPILGLPETNQNDLNRIVEMLDRRGWQILMHAIGDGGIRMTLDAFERARKLNPAPVRAPRHRLEHIESISVGDINRFASLGVIASMQPYHANPNGNIFGVWAVNLGPERASRAWVWKSIRDAGGQLAFGSDWPVVSIDPRLGMHTALTRQTLGGQPPQGFIPEQRLTLDDVLDTYTRGSAIAEFAEMEKGTLAVGMLADVIVWDQDLFSLPVDQVHKAKVSTTIFDGQIVYPLDK